MKVDETRYLTLFHSEKFDRIFDKVKYLVRLKSNIFSVYFHNAKIKIDSNYYLPLEKTINMQNVVKWKCTYK